jgi:hypothetical protein
MGGGSRALTLAGCVVIWSMASLRAADDPAERPNPFGDTRAQRTDALAGAVYLSDGTVIRGDVYLTRGHDLRIYDASREENRDIPLRVVSEVTCHVEREWLEREWRFKENGNDEKVYTGRTYPARIYTHEIRLTRGDVMSGPLSVVVYVTQRAEDAVADRDSTGDPAGQAAPLRFLLHKRDKGEPGEALEDLVYVTRIVLGDAARNEESDSDDAGGETSALKASTSE